MTIDGAGECRSVFCEGDIPNCPEKRAKIYGKFIKTLDKVRGVWYNICTSLWGIFFCADFSAAKIKRYLTLRIFRTAEGGRPHLP